MKTWKKITKSTLPKPNSFIVLKNCGLSRWKNSYQVTIAAKDTTLRGYTDNGWTYYLDLPEFDGEK